MKRSFIVTGAIAVFIMVFSCGRATFVAYYDMKLRDVEKPSSVTGVMDSVSAADEQEEGYEDSMVRIFWVPTVTGIAMKLINKTDNSIDILWNEAEFIDEKGMSHRAAHTLQASGDSGTPTSVPGRGEFETIIGSADGAVSAGGETKLRPIFSTYDGSVEGSLRRSVKGYIGKNIRVILPLRIQNQSLKYVNTFEVGDGGVGRVLEE